MVLQPRLQTMIEIQIRICRFSATLGLGRRLMGGVPRRRATSVKPDDHCIESHVVEDDIDLEQVTRDGVVIFVKPQDVQVNDVSSI